MNLINKRFSVSEKMINNKTKKHKKQQQQTKTNKYQYKCQRLKHIQVNGIHHVLYKHL